MVRKKKTAEDLMVDPIRRMEQIRNERKMVQETNWKNYLKAKEELKEEIDENEGTDIQEQMKKERREFLTEQRNVNRGKLPADNDKFLDLFYKRFNVETPLSPEEEEAKRLEEEAADAAKKKKKKAAGAKKKGKKGKKEEDPSKAAAKF